MSLPPAPPEPTRQRDVALLAPWFQAQLAQVLDRSNQLLQDHEYHYQLQVFETLRSDQRQKWLFGSGRSYRGPWLTNASSCYTSWHGYGLAADVVPRARKADGSLGDFTWDVPAGVWAFLFQAAIEHGCTTGLHWHSEDDDHVQPASVKLTPSGRALALLQQGGRPAVWDACHPDGLIV